MSDELKIGIFTAIVFVVTFIIGTIAHDDKSQINSQTEIDTPNSVYNKQYNNLDDIIPYDSVTHYGNYARFKKIMDSLGVDLNDYPGGNRRSSDGIPEIINHAFKNNAELNSHYNRIYKNISPSGSGYNKGYQDGYYSAKEELESTISDLEDRVEELENR